MDWLGLDFLPPKLNGTGHGLYIFAASLDFFYLDMDFNPLPGLHITKAVEPILMV